MLDGGQAPAGKAPSTPAGLPRAVHAWALGLFALLTLALAVVFFLYRDVNLWEGLRESRELGDIHYSETVYMESVFRTRANTWSNLAFVLVGLYALVVAVFALLQIRALAGIFLGLRQGSLYKVET